jgi:hypothetical protein
VPSRVYSYLIETFLFVPKLHSYRFEDIVFQSGARFRPCVEAVLDRRNNHNFIRVDLDRFHGIDVDDGVGKRAKRLGAQRKRFTSMRPHDSFFTKNRHEIYEITNVFAP